MQKFFPLSFLNEIKKTKKIFNPKPVKQIARENIKKNDRQLNEKLAKKLINP